MAYNVKIKKQTRRNKEIKIGTYILDRNIIIACKTENSRYSLFMYGKKNRFVFNKLFEIIPEGNLRSERPYIKREEKEQQKKSRLCVVSVRKHKAKL